MTAIAFYKTSDLSAETTTALRALSAAVYPPEVLENLPSRHIEWSPAEWKIITWDADKTNALSHVGVQLRHATVDGAPAYVGGVGGVATHPQQRGRGLAAAGLKRAIEFFAGQKADFALLVCRSELVPLYQKLGWQTFKGTMLVIQRGERQAFTFNVPMVFPLSHDPRDKSVIDLQGLPW